MNKARKALDAAYDGKLAQFRAASKIYTAACHDYRAKITDDATFLAARKVFDAAQTATDVAESEYIDAVNKLN